MFRRLYRVHFLALLTWVGYTVLSRTLQFGETTTVNVEKAYLLSAIFNIVFVILFLYLFSHDKFFEFAREIEMRAKKKEKGYTNMARHWGKLIMTGIVGLTGSPLYIALTIRLFWPKLKSKYLLAGVMSVVGGWLWLTGLRGSWLVVMR